MIEETPEESASTPRTREASPPRLLGSEKPKQDIVVQLKEDHGVCGEDSDSPIVLGDGRADHKGKGRAEDQCRQSTHARKRTASMHSYDFYWARTKKNRNHKMIRRRTNKRKFRSALAAMKKWLKEQARNWPLKMILSSLRARLKGYWNYYCVISNSTMTWRYHAAVMRLVFKWLNRRNQRRSYGWQKFAKLWVDGWRIPAPRCVEARHPEVE